MAKQFTFNKPPSRPKDNIDHIVMSLNARIENLKTQYNLFFTGEIRIPPEGERESIEKIVRDLQVSTRKSARTNLLIQNLSSKFSLYNNMWKKRLNEIETGLFTIQRKKRAYTEEPKPPPPPPKKKEVFQDVSLNREDSFDNFYDQYTKILKKSPGTEAQKNKVINSLKTKLISQNLIDAKVSIAVDKGKLKLKIKKE
jgi:hypothetical protein